MSISNSNGGVTYPRLLLSSIYGLTAKQALLRDLQLKGTPSSGSQVEGVAGRKGHFPQGSHLTVGIRSPSTGQESRVSQHWTGEQLKRAVA